MNQPDEHAQFRSPIDAPFGIAKDIMASLLANPVETCSLGHLAQFPIGDKAQAAQAATSAPAHSISVSPRLTITPVIISVPQAQPLVSLVRTLEICAVST